MSITDTTTTVEKIAETLLTAAAEMAEKLGMKRTELNKENQLEWRAVCEDELMMLVTSDGITLGNVKVHYGEMRTYTYEIYTMNGVDLFEKRYGITETGWEHMPTLTYKLHTDTIIYSGW